MTLGGGCSESRREAPQARLVELPLRMIHRLPIPNLLGRMQQPLRLGEGSCFEEHFAEGAPSLGEDFGAFSLA